MEALSLLLWRERELLDTLLFKLELEQLVLSTGRTRWLTRATREVQAVIESLRETEVLRAAAADGAASDLGLPATPTLRMLAESAPAPWDSILDDHRTAFASLTHEIQALADANRELLTVGYKAARDALDGFDLDDSPSTTDTYTPFGSGVSRAANPRFVDRSL